MALIEARRRAVPPPFPQRLMGIVNSGFPETHQNSVALAICREFALQSGFTWTGGLALGGGGAVGGDPLTAANRSGAPVKNLIAALDITAATLAGGLPVPAEAARLFTKNGIPFPIWRRLLGSRKAIVWR